MKRLRLIIAKVLNIYRNYERLRKQANVDVITEAQAQRKHHMPQRCPHCGNYF